MHWHVSVALTPRVICRKRGRKNLAGSLRNAGILQLERLRRSKDAYRYYYSGRPCEFYQLWYLASLGSLPSLNWRNHNSWSVGQDRSAVSFTALPLQCLRSLNLSQIRRFNLFTSSGQPNTRDTHFVPFGGRRPQLYGTSGWSSWCHPSLVGDA